MPQDYSKTLNLPNTDFSMRANLPQREPEIGRVWLDDKIYEKTLERNEGHPLFILHDGPPFSNGNIHMGTAMNKLLKDFINKYKSMSGFKAPYVPGWDNHGMPIESAIIKKNKLDRKKMSISEFRSACHKFADDFVHIQMDSFKRLGVLGDWDNPYLTMDPKFEAREVKVFGEMFKKGYIYKGLKPVYWCPHDETALAEAEIEYKDVPCTSIYVKFKVKDDLGRLSGLDLDKTYFVIWTTTTWTLPGNLAIAVHPREKYVAIRAKSGEIYIVADMLADRTMQAAGIDEYERIAEYKGADLEYIKAQHPFLDRESVLVLADYVTMDSGTGCVHTAPGFGADDYVTCRRYKIDIIVPVDDRGYQTEDAGKFAGLYYEKSNEAILADLRQTGALLASEEVTHSYPHCWRCKNPIIFRATPQWFCSVDAFRADAVDAADKVEWIPEWGHDRMISMINERADWCISRQRHWGLPIPVFYCDDCKQPIADDTTIKAVSDMFAAEGSNSWFDKSADEILPAGYKCPHCGGTHFTKETDTLDGWFDSGSTHFAVLENGELSKWSGMQWPADLYLEGADQYRGWFQSSLLTAVGAKGQGAPYRQVLTHGWVVDGEGKAMHKSLGNSIAPEEIIKKYGADILRLWVASSDYQVDVRVSDPIFKQLSETYRKIRNTARIIMANLGKVGEDFNPDTDMLPVDELYEIDKWALARLNRLLIEANDGYEHYEFHNIIHAISNFCTVDMSKLYIDITKDRLYVEKTESKARRSAQTAMYIILSSLTRLIAPLLSYTAEEIWHSMKHISTDDTRSVFLSDMPKPSDEYTFSDIEARWNKLFDLRDDVMKALEVARADKQIGKSLDAKLTIYTSDKDVTELLESFGDELETVFIVSGCKLSSESAPAGAFTECVDSRIAGVLVEAADGVRCDRCWKYSTDTHADGDSHLCARCKSVIEG
ncbi:MAG TPA: isoleucine--tRNA ligase [Firmicutes bacterium]|nr:isoleucine--tRNA ligase [Bacillota bacterium]